MEVGLIVLGAFLALIGGVVNQYVNTRLQDNQRRRLLTSLLIDELENIATSIAELQTDEKRLGFFP